MFLSKESCTNNTESIARLSANAQSAGRKQYRYYLDLTADPDYAKYYDWQKNFQVDPSLNPEKVLIGAKVWWRCSKGEDHIWRSCVWRQRKPVCVFCKQLRASAEFNLELTDPAIAKQFHATKNGKLRASDLTPGSCKKVFWQCDKNALHVWKTTVQVRTKGSGCPYCAGKRVSADGSLASLNKDLASQWDFEKNGDLTPEKVSCKNQKSVYWVCRDENHRFRAKISGRVKDPACPYCTGRLLPLAAKNLAVLYPNLAKQWHPVLNGNWSPEEVTPGSKKRAWWQCPNDSSHTWQAKIGKRAREGSGCPSCSKRKIPDPDKSFAATHPHVACDWDWQKNFPLTPFDFTAGSNKFVWWRCQRNAAHSEHTRIVDRIDRKGSCKMCNTRRRIAPETRLAAKMARITGSIKKKKLKCRAIS